MVADYGFKFFDVGQPTIVIQNASNEMLHFFHTDACVSEKTSCVNREYHGYWLQGPPKVGDTIAPNTDFSVGKLDVTSATYYYTTFFSFATHPDIVLAVTVTTYSSGNVYIQADRYLPSESGYNGRADLVTVEPMQSTVTIRIPGPAYWLSAKRAYEAYDGTYNDGTYNDGSGDLEFADIIGKALGTLITTYFVVPGWGIAAVGLTLVEGILNLVLSPASIRQRTAVTQFKAFLNSNMQLFKQQRFDYLRAMMDTASNNFEEENLGTNAQFTNIYERIDGLKNKLSFDDELKDSITACLKDLAQVVSEQSPFQQALEECLGVMSQASDAFENPSQSRLALVFAATSMTMNAYALATILCTFIKVESRGWRPQPIGLMSSLDMFDPKEGILKWMFAIKRRIAGLKTKENAKANRFGHVCMEADTLMIGFEPMLRLYLYDSGIGVASWGAGTEKDADDLLAKFKLNRNDWYTKVPSWSSSRPLISSSSNAKETYDESKHIAEAYKTYLDGLIDAEYKKLAEDPLAELEKSRTPYFALLAVPHSPPEGSEITSVEMDKVQTFALTAELHHRFVQYGYSFVNSSGGESTTRWQMGVSKLEAKWETDNGQVTFAYPMGAKVVVPTDPWNTKAKAFAVKANSVVDKSDPKNQINLPPYSSSTRYIYRRFCTVENSRKWTDSNSNMEMVGTLDNSGKDDFYDDWTDALQALG